MSTGSWQKSTIDNVVEHPRNRQKKKRRSFRFSSSKLPLVVVFLLLVYVAVSLGGKFDALAGMQRDLQAMQAEVEELREVNRELSRQLELLRSDAYVEQVAREKLGLVKPGETRIVPVPPGTAGTPPEVSGAEIAD